MRFSHFLESEFSMRKFDASCLLFLPEFDFPSALFWALIFFAPRGAQCLGSGEFGRLLKFKDICLKLLHGKIFAIKKMIFVNFYLSKHERPRKYASYRNFIWNLTVMIFLEGKQ